MVGISLSEPAIVYNKKLNAKLGADVGRAFNRFFGKAEGAGLPKI